MTRIGLLASIIVTGIVLTSGFCLGQTPSVQPASAAAPAANSPAATMPASPPAIASSAEANVILNDLEKAGDKYVTVEANIVYRIEMRMSGDEETRTGRIAYQKKTDQAPARFYIRFDTLRQGEGKVIEDKVEYALDNPMWVVEVKHRIKKFTRYQVAAQGENFEPLRLGKGPFPLPFGQKTEDVLKYCEVATRDPKPVDLPGTRYIKMTTRKEYKEDMSFLWLEMWVDKATSLPTKLVSENKNKERTTVVFSGIKTNAEINPKLFIIERPSDYQLDVVPLEKKAVGR